MNPAIILSPKAFTPASVAGFNSGVFVALSRQQGKLWQDAGKTTPATADGHLVRVATCPFSGVDFAATSDAARPTLKGAGSFWWLQHSGTTNLFRTVALTQPYWVYASGVMPVSGATLFDGQTALIGAFYQGTLPGEGKIARAGAAFFVGTAPADASIPLTCGAVFNGASTIGSLNGVETVGNAGANNATGVSVGTRGTTLTDFATKVWGYACGSGIPSAADRAAINAYMAGLIG